MLLLSMSALAVLGACRNDDTLGDGGGTGLADGVYMRLTLSMATATRSATTSGGDDHHAASDGGVEYGKDYENAVGDVLVVLVKSPGTPDESVVASAVATEPACVDQATGHGDTYLVSFGQEGLSAVGDDPVGVYVYCNPEPALRDGAFRPGAAYTLAGPADDSPWASGRVFMSSAGEHLARMPFDLDRHRTPADPIDLGTVEVERSVARIDYRDGGDDNVFTVTGESADDDSQDASVARIRIHSMAVVNMSRSFHHLRHMAESSAADAGVADLSSVRALGTETATNWVVDTDAAAKAGYAGSGLSANFLYPLADPSTWEWTTAEEIASHDEDNDDSWNGNSRKGDYHVWRYVTENTIPTVDAQRNGISTGVVFRGQILPLDWGTVLGGGKGGRVYVFGNRLYASWDDVVAAASSGASATLRAAVTSVLDAWAAAHGDGDFDETDPGITKVMAGAGLTGYSPGSDGNYYCYFYYWIRHNDNGRDPDMGIMEFATVRNNVYKLCIGGISHFGHPAPDGGPDSPADPDPDPVDPNRPDEVGDHYFTVEMQVQPWVVREDCMTF